MDQASCSECGEQISTDVRTCPECGFAPWKPLLALGILGPCCAFIIGLVLLFLSGIPLLADAVWGIGALTLFAWGGVLFGHPTD